MTKKRIYHLLKRYRYIMEAIHMGKDKINIRISGRYEIIHIDATILTFVEIVKTIYNKEQDVLIKKFIYKNVIQEQPNTKLYVNEPLDKSTYYHYKNKFVDKIYHGCIYFGLVTLQEIIEEKIV